MIKLMALLPNAATKSSICGRKLRGKVYRQLEKKFKYRFTTYKVCQQAHRWVIQDLDIV